MNMDVNIASTHPVLEEMDVWDFIEAAKNLSRTQQIDLLYYLARHLNKDSKVVELCFLPAEKSMPTDELFTDEEFESLLEWLASLRSQKSSDLALPIGKRIKLIELISETFMQHLPTPNTLDRIEEIWPEDDIAAFEQFLRETRHQ